MCFHVDDVMISSPRDDPEFKRMMDKVKRLYEWSEWEQHEFDEKGKKNTAKTLKNSRKKEDFFCKKRKEKRKIHEK